MKKKFMKFIKNGFLMALFLLAVINFPVSAAKYGIRMGDVTVQYMVDAVYSYKDSVQVCFKEKETDRLFTVSCEDFNERGTCTVKMPEGEWEYYSLTLENRPEYGALGYLLDTESFEVKEGEHTNITVLIEEHHTSTQLMEVELDTADIWGFDGTVQIWMEGEADAYYTDTEERSGSTYSGTRIQESYVLRFDPNVGYTAKIDAGTYRITEIRAYDQNQGPLNIAYEEKITIGRYNDQPKIRVYAYGSGEHGYFGSKYKVRTADSMPPYENVYYIRTADSYEKFLGIEEKSPFAELREQTEEEIQAGIDEELEYRAWIESLDENPDVEGEVIKTPKNILPYVILLLSMFCTCGYIAYRSFKKKDS